MPGCSKKVKHLTAARAQAAMEAYQAQVVYILGMSPMGWPSVYQCRRCGYWHWGHSWSNEAPAPGMAMEGWGPRQAP